MGVAAVLTQLFGQLPNLLFSNHQFLRSLANHFPEFLIFPLQPFNLFGQSFHDACLYHRLDTCIVISRLAC